MRLLLDTNILLDVALQRQGLVVSSAAVISTCAGTHEAGVSWHSLSNSFYIINRHYKSTAPAWSYCQKLLSWATIITTDHHHAQRAMQLGFDDLEDAMQVAAAESFIATHIITRNMDDFADSPIAALTPEQFIQLHHPELLS